MSKLWQKKWQLFKKQKRAYGALIVFAVIFVLSMLAPFIANDKPLFVWYKGSAYWPIFENYTDRDFGGSLPTYADKKDAFTKDEIAKNGFMIMPPVPFSYDTINYELDRASPAPPSGQNWLGTDDQARDVLARLLYGLRISILFGLVLTLISSVVGIFVGALQGYFGGKTDLFMQRFLEIWGSLPQMFVLIIVSSIFLPSFWTLLIVLLLFSWTSLVGVVRAEFLRARNFDYVKAARALGVSDMRIMLRHILPNALVASVTYIPFILSGGIVALTALDFLGFGLPAGSPSMGELVRQGKDNINAVWLGLSAFVSMACVLVCLVFIGEGVRSAFDTRQKTYANAKYQLIAQKPSQKLLCVRHLSICFAGKKVVDDVSFDIEKGQTVALVGESGSGKSVTSLAILGVLQNALVSGSVQLNGQELIGKTQKEMAPILGRQIGLVFQEPMTSLNPLHKIEKQIKEVMLLHKGAAPQTRVYELLELVGLTRDKKRILKSYPHQLSGGQRQRVMIVMALAGNPELLIADEPTTALDVVLQKQVLDLMKDLQAKLGLSILFISHDSAVVSYMTKTIYQMHTGRLTRLEKTEQTSVLSRVTTPTASEVLRVQDLSVCYGKTVALAPISFSLSQGRTLAIVGESGSGKTSLAMGLLKLAPSTGHVLFQDRDIFALPPRAFNAFRQDIQIVFQDPFSSLNPRMTIGQIVGEGLRVHQKELDITACVKSALSQVDLPSEMMDRYPHELSGGQRQRVAIARALILKPKVLILDEPTSALDAKNRQKVLSLLAKLQAKTGIAYLLITHDMNVVRQMADDVIVLKAGRWIEQGQALSVLIKPNQAYTKQLQTASFLKL